MKRGSHDHWFHNKDMHQEAMTQRYDPKYELDTEVIVPAGRTPKANAEEVNQLFRKLIGQIEGVQLKRHSPVISIDYKKTGMLPGEWAARRTQKGTWTGAYIVRHVDQATLKKFHEAVEGSMVDFGNTICAVSVIPLGGWGVLSGTPLRR